MNEFRLKLIKKKEGLTSSKDLFKNEDGAIDLSSIMVGIIVIGLIGGVIAATVFSVIPWSQDNAAKQQLDSIVSAQSAYFALSTQTPSTLPAGSVTNSYGTSAQLAAANLLPSGTTFCTTANGNNYNAYSKSASGKVWRVSSTNSEPELYEGALPSACASISPVAVDPTPKLTTLTYRCDTAVTGRIPMSGTLTGTEKWSDGATTTYAGAAFANTRTFQANVEYKLNFTGTYSVFRATLSQEAKDLNNCLRSVDHWGSEVGVVDATSAFWQAYNLTDVPDRIPTTITIMYHTFGFTKINDPSISKWDVSNVENMRGTFRNTTSFNQPLKDWDVSKVQVMDSMFYDAASFNQDLSSWNTASVTYGITFATGTFPTEYLPAKTSK